MSGVLSVIIPIYNKTEYLCACLEDVLSQTLADIEVICVDDGSTDGSRGIAEEFAKRDSRVKLIAQPNLGAGAARNAGIRAAKGEYIAFLDSDDFYPSKDTLARIYAAAKRENALICGGSLVTVSGDKLNSDFGDDLFGNKFEKEGWVDFSDYQYDYAFYRFIYSREFLLENGLFFPDYRRYQDPPFMLRAFAAAGKFYALAEPTYCYRINHCSVNWTTQKVYDLLCGVEDNLRFSAEHGYARVHCLNYNRLCRDFCGPIVSAALSADGEGRILKKLIEVQRAADADMLSASDRFTDEEVEVSAPFAQIIQRLSAQNMQLRREGWFVNNKLFRLYTAPVRWLGKLTKKLRKK